MTDTRTTAHRIYKSLPPGFSPQQLQEAYVMGLMRKQDLEDGALYHGHCRNASTARWDASRQRFVYRRTKFTATFDEDIVHPADDEGFDVFAVVAKSEP